VSAAAIQANKLVKWFGEGEAKTFAIREVSFEANFGEMLYIEGPSGSGKTTLLSMISGILRPNSGGVTVKNLDIWSLPADQLADFRLNTIGFVFQDYHLFPRLTTAENVAIPLILKKQDWDASLKLARQYLEIVGLRERAELPPVKLSGGEQQRVAIARAIVNHAPIILADEPTGNLDTHTSIEIMELFQELNSESGITILLVTHEPHIATYSRRIVRFLDGRLVGDEART